MAAKLGINEAANLAKCNDLGVGSSSPKNLERIPMMLYLVAESRFNAHPYIGFHVPVSLDLSKPKHLILGFLDIQESETANMESMLEEWKKELIDAGKLKPDQEITTQELMMLWSTYSQEKIKKKLSGSFADLVPKEKESRPKPKPKPQSEGSDIDELRELFEKNPELASKIRKEAEAQASQHTIGSNVNPQEGIKLALNALIKKAKGSSYCMIAVDGAWINFRFKRSKNNLHLQVAGNKYISPRELQDSDIQKLESMGIHADKYSIDIYAINLDDEPRDLDMIADMAISIFNDVYHIEDGEGAYLELEMDMGEDESVRNEISQYFKRRDGKKFKWKWSID